MLATVLYIVQIVLGILIIYMIWALFRARRLMNIGQRIAHFTIPFQRLRPGAKQRILIAGDSSAVGTGATRHEDSTAGRIAADYPEAEIANLSRNGMKAAELLERLERAHLGTFDMVVLQIGGNDIIRGTKLPELEQVIRKLVPVAKKLSPRVVIMHSGNLGAAPFFPWLVGKYFTQRTRLVRDMYIKIAKDFGIVYADLFEEKPTDVFSKESKRYYAGDLFHPSSEGYGLWYEGIKKALFRLDNDQTQTP